MDIGNINPFARRMAEDLVSARPSIPINVAVSVANYKMANICSQLGIMVDTKSGYGETPANIYALTLASSGTGKNASLGLIDKWYFKDAFDHISETVYPQFKRIALAKLEKEDNERPIHTWTKAISNSTTSGLYAYAESYCLTGFGGINAEIDEIGNAVISKAELFEILLTPYDNGDFVAVAKRTDSDAMTIRGLPVNLYCFGNKVRLLEGDAVETAFMKLLDEGYGRRFIFTEDTSVPKRREADDIVREMELSEKICKDRETDREYIKSLITKANLGKVLPFTREAMLEYATIKANGENYILDHKGLDAAVKTDMNERNFKTAKLAGIYAFFEGSNVITKEHMRQAFEVIKESSEILRELRKVKPKHQRLLEALVAEEKPCTSQHMLNYSFIPSSWTRKVDEFVQLAQQLASEKGYIWKTTVKKGVEYYEVKVRDVKTEKILKEVDAKEEKETVKNKMTSEELIAFLEE